jgi:hypothetical protein
MEPLVNRIIVTAAHGTAFSALPNAPVVPERPALAVGLRRRTGLALHAVARRVEPRETTFVDGARYHAA